MRECMSVWVPIMRLSSSVKYNWISDRVSKRDSLPATIRTISELNNEVSRMSELRQWTVLTQYRKYGRTESFLTCWWRNVMSDGFQNWSGKPKLCRTNNPERRRTDATVEDASEGNHVKCNEDNDDLQQAQEMSTTTHAETLSPLWRHGLVKAWRQI